MYVYKFSNYFPLCRIGNIVDVANSMMKYWIAFTNQIM